MSTVNGTSIILLVKILFKIKFASVTLFFQLKAFLLYGISTEKIRTNSKTGSLEYLFFISIVGKIIFKASEKLKKDVSNAQLAHIMFVASYAQKNIQYVYFTFSHYIFHS